MEDSALERRRHRRRPLALAVDLSTVDSEIAEGTSQRVFRSVRATSGNLSRGGLFVPIRKPLSPGRRVLVMIHLPDGRGVEAVGRVAWSRLGRTPDDDASCGNGLELVGGAPRELAALEAFLDS